MTGRQFVWTLVVVLGILHYDFWYWDDRALVFGFMPVGLLYHAGYSVAAGITWALAIKLAWPSEIEEWADGDADASQEQATA